MALYSTLREQAELRRLRERLAIIRCNHLAKTPCKAF
jgi:hypothetical protein